MDANVSKRREAPRAKYSACRCRSQPSVA